MLRRKYEKGEREESGRKREVSVGTKGSRRLNGRTGIITCKGNLLRAKYGEVRGCKGKRQGKYMEEGNYNVAEG